MNSDLYGNIYPIPKEILQTITSKMYASSDAEGVRRAKNLVKNGYCTYSSLKRLKNFFDTFNSDTSPKEQYELAGGDMMRNFVESKLSSERKSAEVGKEAKIDIPLASKGSDLKAQSGRVNFSEGVNEGASEGVNDALNRNALLVIFDDEMKILLLKRSDYPDQWMPSKISLVGGTIEEGEEPDQAAIREAKEEIGIEFDKLIEKFTIQRNENNVEHLFVTKLPEQYNNDSIKLNEENSDYMWLSYSEIKELPPETIVPNLLDYIRIAVEKYE